MTCGLHEHKASFKQRKTDGEGIRLARKAEELMMSDVGRQGEYGPAAGACGQRRGQRGVAGRTRGRQRVGVEEAGGSGRSWQTAGGEWQADTSRGYDSYLSPHWSRRHFFSPVMSHGRYLSILIIQVCVPDDVLFRPFTFPLIKHGWRC